MYWAFLGWDGCSDILEAWSSLLVCEMQGCTFFCEVCDSWCFRLLLGSINENNESARTRRVLSAQTGQVWLKMAEELNGVLIGIRELGMKLGVGWWILFLLSPRVMPISKPRVVVHQDSLRGWWWLLWSCSEQENHIPEWHILLCWAPTPAGHSPAAHSPQPGQKT